MLFIFNAADSLHPLPYGMGHIKEVTASIQLCLVTLVVRWHQRHPVVHNAYHTNEGEPRLFDFLTFKEDFGSLEFFFFDFQRGFWFFGFFFFFFYQIIYSMFGFGPVNLDLRAQIQICCLDILEKSLWLEDTVTGGFGKFHNFIHTSWEAYMCCPFSEKKLK